MLAFNHYVLGVGTKTALLFTLTWLYNDLKGGDEGWVLRDGIIAVAFGLYNTGSMKFPAAVPGSSARVTTEGYLWIAVISGVILTTMHVQDLKDQAGDRAAGPRRVPGLLDGRHPNPRLDCFLRTFLAPGLARVRSRDHVGSVRRVAVCVDPGEEGRLVDVAAVVRLDGGAVRDAIATVKRWVIFRSRPRRLRSASAARIVPSDPKVATKGTDKSLTILTLSRITRVWIDYQRIIS